MKFCSSVSHSLLLFLFLLFCHNNIVSSQQPPPAFVSFPAPPPGFVDSLLDDFAQRTLALDGIYWGIVDTNPWQNPTLQCYNPNSLVPTEDSFGYLNFSTVPPSQPDTYFECVSEEVVVIAPQQTTDTEPATTPLDIGAKPYSYIPILESDKSTFATTPQFKEKWQFVPIPGIKGVTRLRIGVKTDSTPSIELYEEWLCTFNSERIDLLFVGGADPSSFTGGAASNEYSCILPGSDGRGTIVITNVLFDYNDGPYPTCSPSVFNFQLSSGRGQNGDDRPGSVVGDQLPYTRRGNCLVPVDVFPPQSPPPSSPPPSRLSPVFRDPNP